MGSTTIADTPEFFAPAGTFIGVRDGAVERALGIHYATATRFAPPVAVPDADAPVDARTPSPVCPQPVSPFDRATGSALHGTTMDEDCLRVSVTTPAGSAPGEALPVMVWIHGGAYASGGGDLPAYDPATLVAEQRVVLVAVTYRLGLLGYLRRGTASPANLGLLDQIEALRWVRRNIAAFGGDPNRVTVFGQSAGADAVAHLLISEGARGLVDRAILQSPPLGITRGRTAMTAAMVEAAGDLTPATPLDEVLRRQAIVQRTAGRFGLMGGMAFGVEYGFTPMPPEDRINEAWEAVAPGLEILLGEMQDETLVYGLITPGVPRALAIPGLGRLLGAFLHRVLVPVTTRAVYGRGLRSFADLLADAGAAVTRYRIVWRPSGSAFGSSHAIELPLLFGDHERWQHAPYLGTTPWSEVEREGRRLRRVWADFARTGRVDTSASLRGLIRWAERRPTPSRRRRR